jgi:hypothetical protein
LSSSGQTTRREDSFEAKAADSRILFKINSANSAGMFYRIADNLPSALVTNGTEAKLRHQSSQPFRQGHS